MIIAATQRRHGGFESLLTGLRKAYRGPYVIYDLPEVARRARALAGIGLQEHVRFLAAAKALPSDALLDAACHVGGGFDVSNGGELARIAGWRRRTGRNELIPCLAVTGPAMAAGDHAPEKIAARMIVNIESPAQLHLLEQLSPWAEEVLLGARIRRPPEAVTPGIPPPMTRFGFCQAQLPSIAELLQHGGFAALHCHLEGDVSAVDSHAAMMTALLEVAAAVHEPAPRLYNLGGGFRAQTEEEVAGICRRVRAMAPDQAEILFEPGAWLTSSAGYGLCRIIAMQHRADLDATLVTVDLSRECHARWSEPRLESWWGPPPSARRLLFFGPTCYEGDFLGAFEWPGVLATSAPEPGGHVLFGGLTGYAEAFNTAFNGVEKAEVIAFGRLDAI